MYNIIYEMSCQCRFDARYWMLGAGALGRPRGMVWGGRREEGSEWGTCVYLWRIHVDIWQNQYNVVKLKNKIKKNNLWRGNIQDTYLTKMSLFIRNLSFTGDPLFHLDTLLGASYFTMKSSLRGGQSTVTSVSQTRKVMRPAFTERRTTQSQNLSQKHRLH